MYSKNTSTLQIVNVYVYVISVYLHNAHILIISTNDERQWRHSGEYIRLEVQIILHFDFINFFFNSPKFHDGGFFTLSSGLAKIFFPVP